MDGSTVPEPVALADISIDSENGKAVLEMNKEVEADWLALSDVVNPRLAVPTPIEEEPSNVDAGTD